MTTAILIALVIVEIPPDDADLHVTDSYPRAEDAEQEARRWINNYRPCLQSA